jgi:hypothetical protein
MLRVRRRGKQSDQQSDKPFQVARSAESGRKAFQLHGVVILANAISAQPGFYSMTGTRLVKKKVGGRGACQKPGGVLRESVEMVPEFARKFSMILADEFRKLSKFSNTPEFIRIAGDACSSP